MTSEIAGRIWKRGAFAGGLPASKRGKAQAAGEEGLMSKLAAWLALWRSASAPARPRPLARIRIRRAALGFPYRTPPTRLPVERDRDCNCVPFDL